MNIGPGYAMWVSGQRSAWRPEKGAPNRGSVGSIPTPGNFIRKDL